MKYAADCLCRHSLLDVDQYGRRFQNGVAALAAVPGAQIIAISPLPCLDWMTLGYRRRLGVVMMAICRKVGVHYVDFLSEQWEDRGLSADHAHLSAAGHYRLGTTLAALLCDPAASLWRAGLHSTQLAAESSTRN
jgi:hypothetical protein